MLWMENNPLVNVKHLHHLQCPGLNPAEVVHNKTQRDVRSSIMSHDKLGGPAKCSEENLVDNLALKHIAN